MPDGVIGRPVKRLEDPRLLRGRACFVDDLDLPGMVSMAILRSPLAHARIAAVDLAAARAAPGVLDVFCAADLDPPLPEIPVRLVAMPEFARFLQPPLAIEKVRFVGEPVAVAVAVDRYRAEDALALIAVEYEPLPVVAGLEEAAAARTLVHERAGENFAVRYRAGRGDADAAFADAAYRRRETFRTHRQAPSPLETRGLAADFDPGRGGLTLWGAAKIAHYNRDVLAAAFGLARDAVELIELDVGGGFGVRGELYPEDYLTPIASRRTGRPVKWIEDRREHLMAANQARDIECTLEIAADARGRILGLRGTLLADIGAYVRTNGAVTPTRAGQFLPGPYAIDNVALSVRVAVTNKTPTGTYRGPGRFEANFFRERMIDLMAGDLGIDPAEIRMRNLLRPDALPYAIGELIPGDTGTAYAEGDYPAVFARLLSAAGYDAWPRRQGRTDRRGRRHGLGLACFVESSAAGPPESARIIACDDGGIEVRVGSSALGQGLATGMAQIAAEALGIDIASITVRHGTTSLLPEGSGTYHSRSTVMGGNAVGLAAEAFRARCREVAALRLNTDPAKLEYRDGAVGGLDITTLAAFAASRGQRLEADGGFDNAGQSAWGFGAHAAHVAVDAETGEVAVEGYWVVEELGRVLNPMLAEGQTVGAVVQGLGGALYDRIVHDGDGQLLTGSLADYPMPISTTAPRIASIALQTHPAASNPLGFKGAGEGGLVAVGGAIGNAIAHALGAFGVQPMEAPLAPDRLRALMNAGS